MEWATLFGGSKSNDRSRMEYEVPFLDTQELATECQSRQTDRASQRLTHDSIAYDVGLSLEPAAGRKDRAPDAT